MRKIRTYSELISLPTFKERFEYLRLQGEVGQDTFGYDRYLNQNFYRNPVWRQLRSKIILRDNACDLAVPDLEIYSKIIIHHMNPITKDDILQHSEDIINPEYLICTSFDTHNAIHYGIYRQPQYPQERTPNDTCPWRN